MLQQATCSPSWHNLSVSVDRALVGLRRMKRAMWERVPWTISPLQSKSAVKTVFSALAYSPLGPLLSTWFYFIALAQHRDCRRFTTRCRTSATGRTESDPVDHPACEQRGREYAATCLGWPQRTGESPGHHGTSENAANSEVSILSLL
jgi:hypothetical protein